MKAYSEAQVPSQSGRVFPAGSANTGIGFEAADEVLNDLIGCHATLGHFH